jgi:hypothetical protein
MAARAWPVQVGGVPVLRGCWVWWHGYPVWGVLPAADAAALQPLVRRALLPAAGIVKRKVRTCLDGRCYAMLSSPASVP